MAESTARVSFRAFRIRTLAALALAAISSAGCGGGSDPNTGSLSSSRPFSAAATDRTGGTLTVTVHDQGRTVLLHDDLNGTVAGGRRLAPAQVAAYLAAYARYPQLPPRCLLDLARPGPAEPAPLTLTAARELAARHGLEVRVRRAGGQSYITFCEPVLPVAEDADEGGAGGGDVGMCKSPAAGVAAGPWW